MDDSTDSVEDEDKAVALSRELQDLWQIAGMQASKWLSNSQRSSPQFQRSIERRSL